MEQKVGKKADATGEAGAAGATVLGFPAHDQRAVALGEIHARPFPLIETPRVLIQLAFMTEDAQALREALAALSRAQGVPPPEEHARYHVVPAGNGQLRWERHSEFSTWLWSAPLDPESGRIEGENPFGTAFPAPGAAISGVRLEIRNWTRGAEKLVSGFDPHSLCYALVEDGKAAAITDFRQDGDGMTRILILDKGLPQAAVGALAQSLIEIETYRTLAMLGLPLAQRLSPIMADMEDRLADITGRMRTLERGEGQELLEELTALAAELEAEAASSLFRFGASRAYSALVQERLAAIGETAPPGHRSLASFLGRRLTPAMRTCESVEARQASLSRKLARAATLLRTWVDVELERQNRNLLESMNRRAKLQLRLQQTVEGLSVAAVSYYVVGLIGYLAKGGTLFGVEVNADYVTAASVPVVIAAIWLLVRRIRRHSDDGKAKAGD